MSESEYFSSSYQAARRKFLGAAHGAAAGIESIPHPHVGPDGEPLFVDVGFIGSREAARILVVISGTHGVEGFAGSGIQTGLLLEGIASRLPPGVSLLMLHSLNPFGMSHLRRVTEDNIDLNRNFRNHAAPYPRNLAYERLADVIAPQSLSALSEVASWSRLLWYRLT